MSETGVTARDSRYDVLFEPVQLGPVRARNRFFQVPHCNGMGYRDPTAQAAMRDVKAEGGWAVVCTEQVEIHPTSDITPFIELRLWDDGDLPALARIADAIHAGGALSHLLHDGMPEGTTRSIDEIIGDVGVMIVGGFQEPAHSAANSLHGLFTRPEQAARLRGPVRLVCGGRGGGAEVAGPVRHDREAHHRRHDPGRRPVPRRHRGRHGPRLSQP